MPNDNTRYVIGSWGVDSSTATLDTTNMTASEVYRRSVENLRADQQSYEWQRYTQAAEPVPVEPSPSMGSLKKAMDIGFDRGVKTVLEGLAQIVQSRIDDPYEDEDKAKVLERFHKVSVYHDILNIIEDTRVGVDNEQ